MTRFRCLLPILLISFLYSNFAEPANVTKQKKYFNTRTVLVTFTALDTSSGVDQMQLSFNNRDWMDKEPFAASKQMTLPDGDGVKCVYVKVSDKAGNWGEPTSGCVNLDTVPPTVTIKIEAVISIILK